MLARRHIPNLLTYLRVAFVPVALCIMLTHPSQEATALLCIFILASLTDFLDGYLARKWNVVSPIGALLDPIADKLLVALMLVYLLTVMGTELFLPVIVILLRELYISGLREFLASRQITLPVSKGGKWKTALQMVAIGLLLLSHGCGSPAAEVNHPSYSGQGAGLCMVYGYRLDSYLQFSGFALLYLSALLAVTSATSYTKASLRHLR